VGGDEFTVILTALNSPEDAMTAAYSLIDSLKRSFNIDGHEITLGASAGISALTTGNVDGAELLRQADSAMYLAKRGGRNRAAHFSNELGSMARERLTLENQLRGAIARNEIYIDYQPEFDLRTGRLIRFEALARSYPRTGSTRPLHSYCRRKRVDLCAWCFCDGAGLSRGVALAEDCAASGAGGRQCLCRAVQYRTSGR
jgi:predicted signal transduction protein with EAL and GGDEF domain